MFYQFLTGNGKACIRDNNKKKMNKYNFRIIFLGLLLFFEPKITQCQSIDNKGNSELLNYITSRKGFVALWSFAEPAGSERKAVGADKYPLQEGNGRIERVDEGPISGYSVKLEGSNYLKLSNSMLGQLNIHGVDQEISVVAFIKWTGEQNGFIGGMWNEYHDGGKRQYGLFVSLPHYNGADQVCGHISRTGKPTPPFPYSLDYSASKQKVPVNEWCCVAFTYDGTFIKSYFNGVFKEREPELIKHTKGFKTYPQGLVHSKNPYFFPYGIGNNGSDFTVGAVMLKSGMGNFFNGYIGGLAVFNKVLSDAELKSLYNLSLK